MNTEQFIFDFDLSLKSFSVHFDLRYTANHKTVQLVCLSHNYNVQY